MLVKQKQIFFILAVCWSASFCWSQQKADTTDIKVGLVLSGGGAKGLAHIGVLKVIDELGIRLDYISGSSMGAIVGGLYASGYSGKQLDSLFQEVNFSDLIQDKLPRRTKTFYEKEDAEKYALTLPVVDKKIGLPKGISNGQNFYNFYSKLTTHVRDINDFSKLPIPFFCTGTDIETGEALIFDKGHLPNVVSASGALPSVYSPVNYNGRLVMDGGVTNNYPVEEIRKRGVELVIGVDVQDTLFNKSELNSATNIMLQISNFRIIKEMKSKQALTDIYIKPDIKSYNVLSFQEGENIINEGESQARKQLEALKKIAALQSNNPSNRTPLKPTKKIKIAQLNIKNNINYTRSYIKSKMRLNTPNEISLDDLNSGLDNLYSTRNFDHIRYSIKKNSTNKNVITVDVEESKTKSYVRFGLHYDNLYKSAAILNFTHKNLLFQNDVISFDAILGDNLRYNFDYYIDQGYHWSVGISNRLYQYDRDIDFNLVKARRGLPDLPVNFIDINYLDVTTQLYLETLLNQTFAFRIGAEHKFLRLDTDTVGLDENEVPGTVFDEVNFYSLFSSIKFDSFDDKYFPSRGVFFEGSFSAYPISSEPSDEFEEFAIAKSTLSYAIPISKHFSAVALAQGGVRLGRSTGINSLDFFLGGFGSKEINNQVSFLGHDFLELSGDSFVKASGLIDYKFLNKHHVNLTANYGNIGRRIFNIEDWFKRVGFSGYAIGYGYNSIIGPIQLKYTYSPDQGTNNQLLVSVGYWF